jgi:4'-phosphopantetheinyl transferase EntD
MMGGPGPSALALVEAATRALFDVPVAVAVTEKQHEHPAAFGVEAAHVARAVPARQAEFAAGRAAVRAAMDALGMTVAPVVNGPDRAPVWPAGCIGSLSHGRALCVAVLARSEAARSIGIDIEDDSPLDPALIDTICTPTERAVIEGSGPVTCAKLIFCAKEAAFKAQYPLTRELFDFQTLEIAFDLSAGRYTATFRAPVGPFAVGDSLPGRFARIADHLVTGVTIRHGTREGA